MMRLFAYGTLRPGGVHYCQIADFVQKIRPACVQGMIFRAKYGNYPVFKRGKGVVFGTILEFENCDVQHVLRILDAIENTPTLYKREVIDTDRNSCAYIYVGNMVECGEQILSGRWTTERR